MNFSVWVSVLALINKWQENLDYTPILGCRTTLDHKTILDCEAIPDCKVSIDHKSKNFIVMHLSGELQSPLWLHEVTFGPWSLPLTMTISGNMVRVGTRLWPCHWETVWMDPGSIALRVWAIRCTLISQVQFLDHTNPFGQKYKELDKNINLKL